MKKKKEKQDNKEIYRRNISWKKWEWEGQRLPCLLCTVHYIASR